MIETFVSRMFALRDAAHVAHWAVKGAGSYAEHVALGDLYELIPDEVDAIVEMYQGYYGLIGEVKPMSYDKADIMKQVQAAATWLGENCDAICNGNAAIENRLQEFEGKLAQVYYRLRNLK